MSLLTNYPHDKHIPHSRPSVVTMYEGEGKHRRPVMSIRPGSWGPLPAECKTIEAYKAGNKICGPLSIDHIPSNNPKYPDGMWKIFRRDTFMRYADADDIQKLAQLCRQGHDGHIEEFIKLPPVLMFSSRGQYDSTLDAAFGADPTDDGDPFDPFSDDGLDAAFDVAPADDDGLDVAFSIDRPRREKNSLEGWMNVIKESGREGRTRYDREALGFKPPADDWEEAFS